MHHSVERKDPPTLTDQLRLIFADLLTKIGTVLNNLGIHPNMLTITGVVGTAVGAYYVSKGDFGLGGLIIILMGPIDALDGAVARVRGESEDFGAFVDSVSDRYIELMIYGGLFWYYIGQEEFLNIIFTFLAAFGSLMVSYVRARGQSLGFETKVGIFTRVERYLVLSPSIFLGYPWVGVSIIAIGANITAFQRITHVRRQSRERRLNTK